jgi:hypothetical protein
MEFLMLKHSKDIEKEFQSDVISNNNFELLAIIRKAGEYGNIEESIRVIGKIHQDIEEEECLLIIEPTGTPLKVIDAITQINSINQNLALYICYEINLDDGWARVKVPVKGFEINVDQKQLFVACGA